MDTSVIFRTMSAATRDALDRFKASHRVKTDSRAASLMLDAFHDAADKLTKAEAKLYELQQEVDRLLDAMRDRDSAVKHEQTARRDLQSLLNEQRKKDRQLRIQ